MSCQPRLGGLVISSLLKTNKPIETGVVSSGSNSLVHFAPGPPATKTSVPLRFAESREYPNCLPSWLTSQFLTVPLNGNL